MSKTREKKGGRRRESWGKSPPGRRMASAKAVTLGDLDCSSPREESSVAEQDGGGAGKGREK